MITEIAIITYAYAMKSAVYGFKDMFHLANQVCIERGLRQRFSVEIINIDDTQNIFNQKKRYTVVLLPPTLEESVSAPPNDFLQNWLLEQHAEGALLCSACAGAFIIAATGLLNYREATTHWALSESFRNTYPEVVLNTDKILINEGDIITAGGLMSWIDLGLELVAQFTNPSVMRHLGKMLVVDTGIREQRYYQSFAPNWSHGDQVIVKAQQILQSRYMRKVNVASLAERVHLTERTFLRRFFKATGFKPNEYLQHLRIQKACELLEETNYTIERIGFEIGYGDTSAYRKVFIKIMGLSPSEFRRRFSAVNAH